MDLTLWHQRVCSPLPQTPTYPRGQVKQGSTGVGKGLRHPGASAQGWERCSLALSCPKAGLQRGCCCREGVHGTAGMPWAPGTRLQHSLAQPQCAKPSLDASGLDTDLCLHSKFNVSRGCCCSLRPSKAQRKSPRCPGNPLILQSGMLSLGMVPSVSIPKSWLSQDEAVPRLCRCPVCSIVPQHRQALLLSQDHSPQWKQQPHAGEAPEPGTERGCPNP